MDQQQLIVKMAMEAWNTHVKRTGQLFDSLSDDQLQERVAPGRNSGYYLLGHLTAIHDALFSLLGIGEKMYPQLEDIFIKNPDNPGIERSETTELRKCWLTVNDKLWQHFTQFSLDEWLQKHSLVTDEDFARERHRNRLNVLLNRTNHLAYHLGQLAFLKR